jgi:HSP20 family molecular chaperone IbpA
MTSPFRKLDQIQGDLGQVTVHVTRVQFERLPSSPSWQPAVNVFRCGNFFFVCVELAGVEMNSLRVRAEARQLTVRGERAAPEPDCDQPVMQVFALEIDHGLFERVLELPAEIEPAGVVAEHHNGLLWIRLPLRSHA